VNSFVPSGTATPVRSGTRSPCFRGPKSLEIFRSSTACRARNFPNELNLTCCCEPACCEQVNWRDHWSSRFQCLTNTPIRQCDFVFGDTRMHASVRESARTSSSPVSNVHRHTTLLRKSRRGELANPESFEFFPMDHDCSASGHRHQGSVRHDKISVLLSWTAGCGNASLTLYFSARHSSNEGVAA
jgi:hypothetical protein